jgi:DNA damage-inducible protein 1
LPDISPNQTLGELKANIDPFIGIPKAQQQIIFQNRPLQNDTQTLDAAGVKDGDMITVIRRQPAQSRTQASSSRQPTNQGRADADAIETMRLQALGEPAILENFRNAAPELASAVNDPTRFRQLWEERIAKERRNKQEQERLMRELDEDPMDEEKQRKIEELIRQQRVDENYHEALENSPECKLQSNTSPV